MEKRAHSRQSGEGRSQGQLRKIINSDAQTTSKTLPLMGGQMTYKTRNG